MITTMLVEIQCPAQTAYARLEKRFEIEALPQPGMLIIDIVGCERVPIEEVLIHTLAKPAAVSLRLQPIPVGDEGRAKQLISRLMKSGWEES
ncbi:MAG: hypothetical protein NTX87_06690 [Planctomycetota bacterium]|nr:hypothetical protein [Planctomycetota bacterium]